MWMAKAKAKIQSITKYSLMHRLKQAPKDVVQKYAVTSSKYKNAY